MKLIDFGRRLALAFGRATARSLAGIAAAARRLVDGAQLGPEREPERREFGLHTR